jgi:hypothetical protein
MAVTTTNLVAGPGVLYTGAFSATEPADSAVGTVPSSAAWTDAGGTNGGAKVSVKQDYFELEVDQVVDIVGRRLQKREIAVETNFAEVTLANYKVALNGGTIVASSGWSSYDPASDTSATQPTYLAMILDAYAPGSTAKRRRLIVRKVLNVNEVASEYKRDGQTFLPVSLAAHYVSTAILPFHIADET